MDGFVPPAPPPLPGSSIEDTIVQPEPPPEHRLYSKRSVALATFFGTHMAGCILVALNFRRLGFREAARWTVLMGVLGVVAIVCLVLMLPDDFNAPSSLFTLPQLWLMWWLTERLQGKAIAAHKARGGKLESGWKAAGIGLATLAVAVVMVFGSIVAISGGLGLPALGSRYKPNDKDEVWYSKGATETDARKVADALRPWYLRGEGVTVIVKRPEGVLTIGLVLRPEACDDPETVASFRDLGNDLAAQSLGAPLVIELMTPSLELKRTIRIDAAIREPLRLPPYIR